MARMISAPRVVFLRPRVLRSLSPELRAAIRAAGIEPRGEFAGNVESRLRWFYGEHQLANWLLRELRELGY